MPNNKECRTCLVRNIPMHHIHKGDKHTNFTLAHMLNSITSVHAQPGDGTSEFVCTKCKNEITNFYSFKQLTERNDEQIYARLGIQRAELQIEHEESLVIEDDVSYVDDDGYIACSDSVDQTVHIVEKMENNYDDYQEVSEFVEEIDGELTYEEGTDVIPEGYNEAPGSYTDYEQIEEVVVDDEDYIMEEELSEDIKNEDLKTAVFYEEEKVKIKRERPYNTADGFSCKLCNGVFPSRLSLASHRRQKSCSQADYQCNECGRFFRTAEFLNAHLKVHARDTCFKCGEHFQSNSELVEHLTTIHSLPFQCETCQKGFRSKSRYNDHKRQHTGEKPYECSVCLQNFTALSTLKQHMLLHSDVKQFKCSYCEKAFSYRKTLIEHENTHTGNKPYECKICGARYSARGNLYAHRRTHTGEQPYSCNHCSKRFGSHNAWSKHMRVHRPTLEEAKQENV